MQTQMHTISFRIKASKVYALDMLASERNLRRTDLLVTAVDDFLQKSQDRSTEPVKGFGLWKAAPEDGLVYQERVRAEWER